MNQFMFSGLVVLMAYLIGSISFAVVVSKLMGLPVNNVATTLYLRGRYGYDVIVGDALVFGEGDSDGNETSISPELTADIIRLCEHQTTE